MKLSMNREEKKGMFGGAYFLGNIKVTLTSEERQIASERRIINIPLIDDASKLLVLCGRSTLSLSDLVNGIQVKAEGNQIGLLGWLEESVREQCKIVKSNLEMIDGGTEEEI